MSTLIHLSMRLSGALQRIISLGGDEPELPNHHFVKDIKANQTYFRRVDDKSAADYNLEGGATLHLVLALRGGI